MSENILLREMEEKDIDDILEIEKESFSTPWTKEAFKLELDNALAEYLVIEVNDKVVAYGGVWFIIYNCHITNIAVKKEYRGQGLGNKILEGLIYLCEINDVNSMSLEVRKSNLVAQNLYKKYDFVPDGIRENYYKDEDEDAIIMIRNKRKA